MLESIPFAILQEIFSLLDIETLCRTGLVSKPWHHLRESVADLKLKNLIAQYPNDNVLTAQAENKTDLYQFIYNYEKFQGIFADDTALEKQILKCLIENSFFPAKLLLSKYRKIEFIIGKVLPLVKHNNDFITWLLNQFQFDIDILLSHAIKRGYFNIITYLVRNKKLLEPTSNGYDLLVRTLNNYQGTMHDKLSSAITNDLITTAAVLILNEAQDPLKHDLIYTILYPINDHFPETLRPIDNYSKILLQKKCLLWLVNNKEMIPEKQFNNIIIFLAKFVKGRHALTDVSREIISFYDTQKNQTAKKPLLLAIELKILKELLPKQNLYFPISAENRIQLFEKAKTLFVDKFAPDKHSSNNNSNTHKFSWKNTFIGGFSNKKQTLRFQILNNITQLSPENENFLSLFFNHLRLDPPKKQKQSKSRNELENQLLPIVDELIFLFDTHRDLLNDTEIEVLLSAVNNNLSTANFTKQESLSNSFLQGPKP